MGCLTYPPAYDRRRAGMSGRLHRRPGAGCCASSPGPAVLTAQMPGQQHG
uniref:Uncharacterized protein n=1 Tax=Castor canadensis TaxID=51338 RepID=A0A8C0X7X9_CASCN